MPTVMRSHEDFEKNLTELMKLTIIPSIPPNDWRKSFSFFPTDRLEGMKEIPEGLFKYITAVEGTSDLRFFESDNDRRVKITLKENWQITYGQVYYIISIMFPDKERAISNSEWLYNKLSTSGDIFYRRINTTEYSFYNLNAYSDHILLSDHALNTYSKTGNIAIFINCVPECREGETMASESSVEHSHIINLTDLEFLELESLLVSNNLGFTIS